MLNGEITKALDEFVSEILVPDNVQIVYEERDDSIIRERLKNQIESGTFFSRYCRYLKDNKNSIIYSSEKQEDDIEHYKLIISVPVNLTAERFLLEKSKHRESIIQLGKRLDGWSIKERTIR